MGSDPRVCVIGAGHLATRRIYPYLGAAGAQLVGVCDLDSDKAACNARRFGATPYTDMDAMLEDQRPDACIICIGPEEHARLACEILARGIPVYTETPPATSATDTLAVARIAQEHNALCVTAFKKRHAEAYSRAKQWLEQFDPVDCFALSIDYASAHYSNDVNDPRRQFLLDSAIHIIDLALFLFGDVTRAFAFARDQDAYAVSLAFASGAVGTLALNDGRSYRVPTEEVEITVRGGNFMTIHNSSCWHITEGGMSSEWREPPTFASAGDSGTDTGHFSEISDFVEAVRNGRRESRSGIVQSYRTMVLYEAVRESAESGRIVEVRRDSI